MRRTLVSLALAIASSFVSAQKPAPTQLYLDLTDAPRRILHITEKLSVHPGENTFEYPQWIPGDHRATGPIDTVTGIRFLAGGKPLQWRRDLVDMYAFHVDVPRGVSQLELHFDFIGSQGIFNTLSYNGFAPEVTILEMCAIVMYPANTPVHDIPVVLTMHVPPGWNYGTALRGDRRVGDDITFGQVSVEQLVDSPTVIGAHCKRFPLAPETTPAHSMDVCADDDASLALKPDLLEHMSNLAREAGAVSHSYHYDHYDFVIADSAAIPVDALEHHQSADYRVNSLDTSVMQGRYMAAYLLPHEYFHSWCGKYRRPIGLATPDYKTPMQDDLLWVYEGLTQYYGEVLAVRAGFLTEDQYVAMLGQNIFSMDMQAGRDWRNVQDTADASTILRGGARDYANWRRGQDYYPEGALLWMWADTIIREKTNGKKSLDDFAVRFLGNGGNSTWKVVPYTSADVVRDLNAVVPYDWAGFWADGLSRLHARAPFAGATNAGYVFHYTDQINPMEKTRLAARGFSDALASLGLIVTKDGSLAEVRWDSPAFAAGIGADDKITAVNGKPYTAEALDAAIAAAKGTTTPIELTTTRGKQTIVRKVDYHDGLRYPNLDRDPSKPDMLADILKPKTNVPAGEAVK